MFAQFVVFATLIVTVLSDFTIHQESYQRDCIDLTCPRGAFDKIEHPLVKEDNKEVQCTICPQCTEFGYSVCAQLRPQNLRFRRNLDENLCTCANSVPEGCTYNQRVNSKKDHNSQIVHICYLSILRTPPKVLALNQKKEVIVTIEQFWHEPYWTEFKLSNLTLFYEFDVKAPEYCDTIGTVTTTESAVNSHVCTATVDIAMEGDPIVGTTKDSDPTNFFDATDIMYDEDQPPEVEFARDVFMGAENVKLWYTVTVERPRQLNPDKGENPFHDVNTLLQSEILKFELETAKYGDGVSMPEDNKEIAVSEPVGPHSHADHKEPTSLASPEVDEDDDDDDLADDDDQSEEDEDDEVSDTDPTPKNEEEETESTSEKPEQQDTQEEEEEEEDEEDDDDDDEEVEEDASTTVAPSEASKEDKYAESAEKEETEENDATEDEVSSEDVNEDSAEETTSTTESATTEEPESTTEEEEEESSTLYQDDDADSDETLPSFITDHLKDWSMKRICFALILLASVLLVLVACCYRYRGGCCCYSDQQKVTSNGYEYHVTGQTGQEMTPLPKAVRCGLMPTVEEPDNISEDILDATIKELQGIVESTANMSPAQSESSQFRNLDEEHQQLIEPESDDSQEMQQFKGLMRISPRLWPCRLRIDALVGNGDFGNMHRGLLIDSDKGTAHDVAVFSVKRAESLSVRELKALIGVFGETVQTGLHPNVISLLAVQQQSDRLLLVLDSLFYPDLTSILRESRITRFDGRLQKTTASIINSDRLISIMLGCVYGCGHLIRHGITHPMLSACNVLVAGRALVKISGFGFANHRVLHQKQFEPRPTRQRWQAPEHFVREYASPTCGQSNIWSLGVLLWEIASFGGTPYAQFPTQEAFQERMRERAARLADLPYCSSDLKAIIELCCTHDRESRPDMTDVVARKLEQLSTDPEKHINLTVTDSQFEYPPILPALEQIVARV